MWLGLDIGTSGVKAVLVDEQGYVVGQSQAALCVDRPRPLWSEQQPDWWWEATGQAVRALPPEMCARIVGIGLAGQMHGAVLLGHDDRPLRPAILWNDGRSAAQCAALEAGEPATRTITGNLAMPGFTAPKLLWVRDHEPQTFAAIAKVLLPKDYIRLMLTGDHASDVSDSAGTLWLDTRARCWSPIMLNACGLEQSQMPELYEGNATTGMLRPAVAAMLGLPIVPVAAGGGDNAAGAIGMGLTEPGQGFLSLGTSGVIFIVSDGFVPDPARAIHAFCHAVPGRWHQMAVVLSAASALDWAVRMAGFVDLQSALAEAQALGDDAPLPVFLPYLSGERTPHNDPQASGVLFGLTHDHRPAHLVRAALEGVAFALADGADALRASGTTIAALTVIGGGARSVLWGRILASALQCRLEYCAAGEIGPALGAAHLARMAVNGQDVAPTFALQPDARVVAADQELMAQMAPRRATFSALYPALKASFGDSAG